MTSPRKIDRTTYFTALDGSRRAFHVEYYAMYSSVLEGIVTDPLLMNVPVDDHMVHRGDGVFETLKCVDGGVYALDAHLDRLASSAGKIGLTCPWTKGDLADLIKATLLAGDRRDALIRVLLSRGSGSLGVSPYDCPTPGLFIVVHALKPSFMDAHPGGARVCSSRIPVKAGVFATIKSCNYLPNALLKKEAVDRGCDFALSFDEQGFLAEGATENAGLLTADGRLLAPRPDRILLGTTMLRVMDLVRRDMLGGLLKGVAHADISKDDITSCAELFIFGTTPDVTSVVEFDGRPVGDGKPGRVRGLLAALLERDLRQPGPWRTPIFPERPA